MDLSVKKVSSGHSHSHHLSSGAYESLRCASRSINSHHLSHSHLPSHHQHQVHSSALNQNLLMNELAARYMILNSELRSSSQSPVHSSSHVGGGGGSGGGGGGGGSLSSLLPYLLLRPFGSSDASSLLSASSPSHSPSSNLHHPRQGDNLLLAAAAAAAAAASSPTNSPRPLGSSSGPGHLLASVVRHSNHHLHHQRHSPALSPGMHSSDIDLPLTVDSVTATADLLLDSTGGTLTHKPRITRPLTGRYVRHGTGASPSTLLSLRKMLEERKMRIKPLPRKGYKKNVRRRK